MFMLYNISICVQMPRIYCILPLCSFYVLGVLLPPIHWCLLYCRIQVYHMWQMPRYTCIIIVFYVFVYPVYHMWQMPRYTCIIIVFYVFVYPVYHMWPMPRYTCIIIVFYVFVYPVYHMWPMPRYTCMICLLYVPLSPWLHCVLGEWMCT